MNFDELRKYAKDNKIKIKDLMEWADYSRPGLESAINNETIELRSLKNLCKNAKVDPARFFDPDTFGNISQETKFELSKQKATIEAQEKEIQMLNDRLEDKINTLHDKEKIIGMQQERLNWLENMAATPTPDYPAKD